MSRTSSLTYEAPLLRIQCCVGKFLSGQLVEWDAKIRKYEYVQPLRISSPTKSLSIHINRKKASHRRHVITKEPRSSSLALALGPTQCSVNQKYLHSLKPEHDLSVHHIVFWRLKEQFLVCEALKKLARQTHTGVKYRAVLLSQETPQPPSYYDNTPTHKERHFQIDRVIKYLS